MVRGNRRFPAERGLEIFSWETYGIANSYDKLLHVTMLEVQRAYWEGRVWDMERAIRSLIALLPRSVKDRANLFFKEEYLRFKDTVRNRLRRSLLPNFYEWKDELLSRLIKVYSFIVDLLDEAGISIRGRRDGIKLPPKQQV